MEIPQPVAAKPTAISPGLHPAAPGAGRLISLDAYRGFIMLLLVSGGFGLSSLAAYPQWQWLAHQVEHVAWEGCSFWDLVQPAFTFMVGMAMPFAIARRKRDGASRMQIFRHVAWRALVLIALSNLYSNWGARPGELKLQFINVLCQIAFGYLICYLILQLRLSLQVLAAFLMLAGYWALFVTFPGPEGPWSKTGNIGGVIDQWVLGYNYSGYYTTINFVGNAVTILFGCWAGMFVRTSRTHAAKLRTFVVAALLCFALGLALEPFNPMVKRLWTASFTFFSTGWVLVMLLFFYWVIEVCGAKRWAFPFLVLGMNSLFVYSLGQIGISGWLSRGLAGFTQRFEALGPAGAIPHQILVLLGLWGICYWLYRRQIFFKI